MGAGTQARAEFALVTQLAMPSLHQFLFFKEFGVTVNHLLGSLGRK
jgi:hypothetical protein